MASAFFFFNDTATTEIYTLSLHDALPICVADKGVTEAILGSLADKGFIGRRFRPKHRKARRSRSEEHTSELQSLAYLVCRLLLEKKNSTRRDRAERAEGRIARVAGGGLPP